MKVETLKKRLYKKVDEIEAIIEKMPYKGDRCYESQKVCLTQTTYELKSNINGIEQSDLKK